jgi:hypothetical protein
MPNAVADELSKIFPGLSNYVELAHLGRLEFDLEGSPTYLSKAQLERMSKVLGSDSWAVLGTRVQVCGVEDLDDGALD